MRKKQPTKDDIIVANKPKFITNIEVKTPEQFKKVFSTVDNPLELQMATKLFTKGIPFTYQKRIDLNGNSYGRTFVIIDFAIHKTNILIEVDGKQHHNNPEQVLKDIGRNNFLVAMGYRVFQFDWETVMSTRDKWDVMRMVKRAMEAKKV